MGIVAALMVPNATDDMKALAVVAHTAEAQEGGNAHLYKLVSNLAAMVAHLIEQGEPVGADLNELTAAVFGGAA